MHKNNEKSDKRAIGLVYDELINKEGKVVYTKSHNLIVNKFYDLVGGLLKNEVTFTGGIQYWAIGEGEGTSWDSLTPAEREAKSLPTLTGLYNEIARVPVTMSYLDAALVPTPTITNRIQILASFSFPTTGYLREFGLFGGNATVTIDSGYMLDHKTHIAIPFNIGGSSDILNRMLRLIL